jgi:general stress protein YciG
LFATFAAWYADALQLHINVSKTSLQLLVYIHIHTVGSKETSFKQSVSSNSSGIAFVSPLTKPLFEATTSTQTQTQTTSSRVTMADSNPANFANLPKERVKEIAAMGGKASHGKDTNDSNDDAHAQNLAAEGRNPDGSFKPGSEAAKEGRQM